MGKIFGTLFHGNGVIDSTSYRSDNGELYEIKSQLQLPKDLDDLTFVEALAFIVRGKIVKYKGEVIVPTSSACTNQGFLKPRKLTFIRSNNNNLSIVVPFRVDILLMAQQLKDLINANGDFPVVCIKLKGEEFATLNDLLGITDKNEIGQAVSAEPANGGLLSNYSRVHEYKSDAVFDSTILTNYQIRTDIPGELPTFLNSAVANSCLGTPITVKGCGASGKYRDNRYYVIDMLLTTGEEQRRQIPVTPNSEQAIRDCGSDLAALSGVYCIGYYGESNQRIHLLID